jgi:hypothetical protein
MGVRLGVNREGYGYHLDLGDLETLTKGLKPAGVVARQQEQFAMVTEYGIAGVEILRDGDTIWHDKDGRTVAITRAGFGLRPASVVRIYDAA